MGLGFLRTEYEEEHFFTPLTEIIDIVVRCKRDLMREPSALQSERQRPR